MFTQAVIDRPWKFDDKFKVLFTVIGLVDLNQEPDAVRPIRDMKSKQMGCLCCVSGHLECNVDIERCGYVPGENIPLNFELCNNSSSQVTLVDCPYREGYVGSGSLKMDYKLVKAKLVENVVYIARHGWSEHSKMDSRVVAQVESTEFVEPGDVQKWFGKFLPIPAVAPTLKTCGIIRADYQLVIKAVPDGCCTKSLKMFFPILIGNVPLRVVYQHAAPPVQPAIVPTAPEVAGGAVPSAPGLGLPAYHDLPPPSYEEAIFGGGSTKDETDDEHTGGPTQFAPRYPTYRFLSNTPTAPVQ
uniref:Arrestin C-terminal-like domain-containing protein n=1 Tax=Romanomermis culicivorax TaxID=13658 RepID=A0A915JFJ0_ROMCU